MYAYSHNCEEFYGYFRSRKEALSEGAEYAEKTQRHIYTGRIIEPNLNLSADWIIDYLTEKAYEQSGGASQNYGFLDSLTFEQKEELETELNKVIGKWLENYHKINFFAVDRVSMHKFRD